MTDPRLKRAGVAGFNKPKRTPSHPKKSHVVVAKEGDKVKTIRFGQQGVTGGNGGQGGPNPGSSSTPGVEQLANPGSVTFNIDGNQQNTTIPANINPIEYKSSYSLNAGGGNAGTQANPGPGKSGGTGQRGYIRLYLLKD